LKWLRGERQSKRRKFSWASFSSLTGLKSRSVSHAPRASWGSNPSASIAQTIQPGVQDIIEPRDRLALLCDWVHDACALLPEFSGRPSFVLRP